METRSPDDFDTSIAVAVSHVAAALQLGILPAAGGLLDQPAKLLAGCRLWERACRDVSSRIETKRGTP